MNSVFTLVFIGVNITSEDPLVMYLLSLLCLPVLGLVSLNAGNSSDTTAPSTHLYVPFIPSDTKDCSLRNIQAWSTRRSWWDWSLFGLS